MRSWARPVWGTHQNRLVGKRISPSSVFAPEARHIYKTARILIVSSPIYGRNMSLLRSFLIHFAVRSIDISPLRGWVRFADIDLFTKTLLGSSASCAGADFNSAKDFTRSR